MRRRIFTFASLLSLLLCLATVVLWVMPSRYWPDHWWGKFIVTADRHRAISMGMDRSYETPIASPTLSSNKAFEAWMKARSGSSDFLGFQLARYPEINPSKTADGRANFVHVGTIWSVKVPFVAIVLFFALLPGIWLAAAWRRRIAASKNRCAKCFYDLTGNTSGVCPECGTAVRDQP